MKIIVVLVGLLVLVGCSLDQDLAYIRYTVSTEEPVTVTYTDFGDECHTLTVFDEWTYDSWGDKYTLNFASLEVYYNDALTNNVVFSVFVKNGFCQSDGRSGTYIDERISSPIPSF